MSGETDGPPGERSDANGAATAEGAGVVSRRALLATAAAGLGVVAGCASVPRLPDPAGRAEPAPGQSPSPAEDVGSAETPTDGEAAPSAATLVVDRVEAFVSLLARGDFESANAMFGGGLARTPPERLAVTWHGLTSQHGAFEGFEVTGNRAEEARRSVRTRLSFATATQALDLVFAANARIVFVNFPTTSARATYVDASRFEEQTGSLDAGGCPLGATLTLPTPANRPDAGAPGVVLVHRNGPRDRDGTVGPNHPYRDLAWGLASRGVAVLRYDKRTLVCDPPRDAQTVDAVVVDDAHTALEALRSTAGVDPTRVGLVGHGIGGTLGPRIAARDGELAGLVLLGAPARPLQTVLLEAERHKVSVDGRVTDTEADRVAFFERRLNRTRSLGPDDRFYVLGTPTVFWRSMNAYDPVATVSGLSLPTVVVSGGRDFVATAEDADLWRRARPDADFRRYPALDHLFMHGRGPSTPATYLFPDVVAPAVVRDLATWVTGTMPTG